MFTFGSLKQDKHGILSVIANAVFSEAKSRNNIAVSWMSLFFSLGSVVSTFLNQKITRSNYN